MVDTTVWTLGSNRLQLAADAAASSAILTLQTPAFQAEGAAQQQSDLTSIVNYEVAAAASKLTGVVAATPAVSYDTSKYTFVSVTIASQAPSFFGGPAGVSAPLLKSSATAAMTSAANSTTASPCVLTLGSTGVGINIDNSGSVIGSTTCGVFSDSTADGSISVNSGTLNGSSIGTAGTLAQSNSGSNAIGQTVATKQAKIADPNGGLTAPTPGACNAATNTYTTSGTYTLNPTVWCGDVVIGGNGSTTSFSAGIYFIVNGNLTFNNADIPSATGVTFVLTGSNPGSITYTNNSNTYVMSAPTTGPTAGFLFWQVCNNSTAQADSFQGGGTLQATGMIYAPCASIDVGNGAQLKGASTGGFNVIAKSIYAHGSALIQATPNPVATAKVPALTN